MWKYDFKVPDQKKYRVIVHTDCKNEADDQFAVAHHLMTPKFDVMGIIAGHFCKNPQEYGEENTAKASFDEVKKVLGLMGVEDEYPVLLGAPHSLEDGETPIESEGARFIIDEALKEDPRPLFVVCQGAITDLASALLLKPEIAERMTVIWIGGGVWPKGGFEFNLMMDVKAANLVFCSKVPLGQVPIDVYKQIAVSLAELQYRVKPCGEIGRYLFDQMVEFNNKLADFAPWPHGETWGLGDQATVTLLLDELEKMNYDLKPAPAIADDMTYIHEQNNRDIRVYHTLDARMTMEDFYAKLAINFGSRTV